MTKIILFVLLTCALIALANNRASTEASQGDGA
jgi:hypothetical protein